MKSQLVWKIDATGDAVVEPETPFEKFEEACIRYFSKPPEFLTRDMSEQVDPFEVADAAPAVVQNNDGRPTCYACGASTRNVVGFSSAYDVCSDPWCGK